MSSAFARGHQLQRMQGTGVPPAAERARENSVLLHLADPLTAIRRRTLGHGEAARPLL